MKSLLQWVKWGDSPAITVLRTQLKHHKPSTVNLQPNSCRSTTHGNKSNTLGCFKHKIHWSFLFWNKSNILGCSKYKTHWSFLYGNKSNILGYSKHAIHRSTSYANKSNTMDSSKYSTHWSFLFGYKFNIGLFQIRLSKAKLTHGGNLCLYISNMMSWLFWVGF